MSELMVADGFDDAVIGIVSTVGQPDRICYDYQKCCEILMEREGWSPEEAEEWMQHNVVCAYVGEGTPAYLYLMSLDQIEDLI